MLKMLKTELQRLSDPEKAKILSRFFKTGKGQYGEGDVFLGIPVPVQRRLAKRYSDLSSCELAKLLDSRIHEERLVSLLVLINKYQGGSQEERGEIADFYLQNINRINNWDLVDLSSGHILGDYLLDKDRTILYDLAKSENLWERRISVMSTFAFIRKNEFNDTLCIAELLLNDREDLIHKAVGWMLREIGKRDVEVEERFLRKYSRKMPRTMLRYAIERFEEEKRKDFMK